MLGMYSIAVVPFLRSHPVDATATTRSAASPRPPSMRTRRSDTDHPDVDRVCAAEDVDDALLVPFGPDLRHPEPKSIVREIPVEDRLRQIREPARHQERGQSHRPADQNP